MIKVMRRCFRRLGNVEETLVPFPGPVLGASCRRKMLTADTSLTGGKES